MNPIEPGDEFAVANDDLVEALLTSGHEIVVGFASLDPKLLPSMTEHPPSPNSRQ